ncbi:MAG: M20/M25/M40 family metallo-hydrolase [Candidatus Acidiferrales bacterium]
MEKESSSAGGRILFSLAGVAAILCLSILGLEPPRPKSVRAPANEFSAGRARQIQARILGDGKPHPTGSAANQAVRDRVVQELKQSGYQPQIQSGFACDEYGTCGTVENILARLDGSAPGQAVLLASHYDSVPAGPGASDDGAGVAAVLEIARALKSFPQPRHSIVLLIDDGEEAGLLGAHVFVDQHPWAKEVRAAVNLDARGTSGPSMMFETGAANQWAVRLYARSVKFPATNSIAYTVYKLMPADTDFTVFKAAGYEGVNFAFIGDVMQYHTPLDNLENASSASLQHHGDNALPMLLALANTDLTSPPPSEAVYFDVFERATVRWPAKYTRGLALGALFLILLQIAMLLRNRKLNPSAFAWGLFAWLNIVLVAGVAALLLAWVMKRAGAIPVNWVAHPLAAELAFWGLGCCALVVMSLAFTRRAGFWGFWVGTWTWWSLLSLLVAWNEPGASYVLVVPVVIAALAGLPFTLRSSESAERAAPASFLPLFAAAITFFVPIILIYAALGVRSLPLIAVLAAVALTPLAPVLSRLEAAPGLLRLAVPGAALALTALAAFAAIIMPAYSAKSPERVNISYWQDADTGKSQWAVEPASGRLPEPIGVATPFRRVPGGPFPWSTHPAYLAAAPKLDLAAPTFTILESTLTGNQRAYRALLRSERGAPAATVLFPPGVAIDSVRVEGEPAQPETNRVRQFLNGWTAYDCVTMPQTGIEMNFRLPAGRPVDVQVVDRSYGLPDEGLFLLKVRPLTATSSQDGDVTVVTRRVELLP